MMRNYKRWVKRLFIFITIVILLVMIFVFVVDPLQYFRHSWYEPYLSKEQRYQNPGLAKNYDYDTIIVGTSMSENFMPSNFNSTFNVKTLKLAMAGSTVREQSLITKLAIRTGKVKNIFWEIHFNSLSGKRDRLSDDTVFPLYLYDENHINDLKYLFNITNIKHSINAISAQYGIIPKNNNIDKLNNWNDESIFGQKVVMDDYQRNLNALTTKKLEDYDQNLLLGNFESNTLEVVRNNPDIQFYFYFPPYSIMYHHWLYETDSRIVDNLLLFKKLVFNELNKYPNVKVYDFQYYEPITFNLDNYKDLGHYSGKINSFMTESMKKDNFLITSKTVDRNITLLEKQIKGLDIKNIIQ